MINDKISRWMWSASVLWRRKACSRQCWCTTVTRLLQNHALVKELIASPGEF